LAIVPSGPDFSVQATGESPRLASSNSRLMKKSGG
jgi:hypothetical protein